MELLQLIILIIIFKFLTLNLILIYLLLSLIHISNINIDSFDIMIIFMKLIKMILKFSFYILKCIFMKIEKLIIIKQLIELYNYINTKFIDYKNSFINNYLINPMKKLFFSSISIKLDVPTNKMFCNLNSNNEINLFLNKLVKK